MKIGAFDVIENLLVRKKLKRRINVELNDRFIIIKTLKQI
jgi:hypothetical protein